MNKNLKIGLGVVVVLAIVVIAWFGFFHKNQQQAGGKPVVIGLLTYYPGYVPFYIAQERGLFKKYGVSVDIEILSADNAFPALGSNQVQMLAGTSDMMAVVEDGGIQAKQIFTTSKSDGADGLAVSNDIKSMQDLKGKTVYVAFGLPDHMYFRNLQQQAGLKLSDISIVNLDPELAASSFVAGKVNAAWTWEPYLEKTKDRKDGHILVTSADYPNLMPEDNVAVTDEVIATRREDVKNIMRAFFEAVDWWNQNPKEGNAIGAKAFGISTQEFDAIRSTVTLANLQTNLDKFDKSKPWNVFEQVDRASEVYLEDGVTKTKATGDATTDASLLQELK